MGRLPYGTKERDIEKFFRNYGRLREINLKNGYGFVVSLSQLHYFAFQSLLKSKGLCVAGVDRNLVSTCILFIVALHNLNLSLSNAWTVFVIKIGQLTPWTIPGLPAPNLQAIQPPNIYFPPYKEKTWQFCSSAPTPAEGFLQFISCEIDKLKSCNMSLSV